jgi:hypothetical protein
VRPNARDMSVGAAGLGAIALVIAGLRASQSIPNPTIVALLLLLVILLTATAVRMRIAIAVSVFATASPSPWSARSFLKSGSLPS